MSHLKLMDFQEKVIQKLIERFKELWETEPHKIPLFFESPTGSGKTIMVANFIKRLRPPEFTPKIAFIWISFSGLAEQSRKKFEKYIGISGINLLTINDINSELGENDIFFVNWEKLNISNEKKEKRKLRRPPEENLRKEDGCYFEDFIEKARLKVEHLVLIIDESHHYSETDLSKEIIEIINPKIILRVSATHKNPPGIKEIENCKAGYIYVNRECVVAEGLIKEKIVTQTKEEIEERNQKVRNE